MFLRHLMVNKLQKMTDVHESIRKAVVMDDSCIHTVVRGELLGVYRCNHTELKAENMKTK